MKFSIKLLLFFFGALGFLMLATDVVLWAYYKKGWNGDGQPLNGRHGEIIAKLKPFKSLVVKMDDDHALDVFSGDSFEVRYWGADFQYDESRVGDTLFLDLQGKETVKIVVPAIDYIRFESVDSRLQLAGLEQDQLTVLANNGCRLDVSDVKIRRLAYIGGRGTRVNSAGGYIDSLGLDIGKNGVLYANRTAIRSVVIAAENLQSLNLLGVSASANLQNIHKP